MLGLHDMLSPNRNRPVLGFATDSDVPELQRIFRACNLTFWTKAGLLSAISDTDTLFLTLRAAGRIIGFVVGRIPHNPGLPAEIQNIGIDPRVRRSGYGSILFNEFMQHCREAGSSEIWLEARESNQPAIQFYENRGCKVLSKRKNYYISPVED